MPVLIPAGGQKLAVNGTDLSTYAVILGSRAPLMHAPAKRSKNVVVPGRHGTIHVPRKRFDEADWVLRMLVLGANSAGAIPGGSSARQELYARIDALMALFPANDTVTLTSTLPDGSTRQCVAEVLDKLDVVRTLGDAPLLGQVAVAFVNPGAFWTDTAAVTGTITGTTGTAATLSAFAGATAPMESLTLTFGPCSNPTVTQGGTYFTYNGIIAAGRQLVVNTGTWSLSTGTGTAWTPSYAGVSYYPGPAWFSLDPTQALSVALTHTGGGSASVTVSGPRAYLSA